METTSELPIALRVAYLTLHRRSDAQFAEYGVTADQFVLLATLARGQALTQRELAFRMSSDPSTVRAMLVLLEKNGLIKREQHPTDSRARTVSLTSVGSEKFQQVWEAGTVIREKMVDSLSSKEMNTLLKLLNRVTKSLQQESKLEYQDVPPS